MSLLALLYPNMRSTLLTCYNENYPVMLTRNNKQSSLVISRLDYRAAG